jgi:hypothetical protein
MLKEAFWFLGVVTHLLLPASVLAFHPDDFASDAALQCVVCNASYYCKNGERYACPANSMATLFADTREECVCNPGYLRSNFELSKSIECPCGYHNLCNGCAAGKFQANQSLTSASTCQQCGAYSRSTRFQTGLLTKASRYLRCVDTFSTGLKTPWLKLGSSAENWLNPDVCFGYEYYVIECGDLFCLTSAQFPPDSLTIPDGNCVGQPSLTPTVNGGRNDHCVAPTNPNIANDGTALGGYHRAAVYKLTDPSILSCKCHLCNNCTNVTCDLGSSPHWYLNGQRNSCPATKGVPRDGSSTVEDCVCLPGYASQGPGVYTPCSPCPAGTFADKHNMSQCTPCPPNSWHDRTQQTNISACLCYAGWAGDSVGGCVECTAGSFSPVNGSAACQVCRLNSDTYDYPRTECKCHMGFYDALTRNVFSNDTIVSILSHQYSVLVANPPMYGTRVASGVYTDAANVQYSVAPAYIASGGYNGNAFLRFTTTPSKTGFSHMNADEQPVSFANGLTIALVVRFLDYAGTHPMWSMTGQIVGGVQFRDTIMQFNLNIRNELCLYIFQNYCPGGTCGHCDICTTQAAPLNVWLRVFFTYTRGVKFSHSLRVEYTTAAGQNVNMQINTAPTVNPSCQNSWHTLPVVFRQMVMGYATHAPATGNGGDPAPDLMRTLPMVRPNFDLAGFYFLQTLATSTDIENIFKAISIGKHVKDLPRADSCEECPANTFKDYIGNLRAKDTGCPRCDPNARSPVQSVSVSACLCQNGFFDNGNNTCQQCMSGKYKGVAENHTKDLELCQLCPANTTSQAQSARIEHCICIPGYSGPNGGPCMACDVGKYKSINGSSSCIDCPLHTWADETKMLACKSCKEFLKSAGGETETTGQNTSESCFCRAGYITNGTNGTRSCAPCAPGNYSLAKNLAECTACPQHTYTDPALFPWDVISDCRVCKLCNTSTNVSFTDHYDAARGGVGCGEASVELCTQCPLASSLFLPTSESKRNFGVRSCVCDIDFYGIVGTACTACPSNQVRPFFIYSNTTLLDCLCAPGFEPDPAAANLCRQCPIGTYKPFFGDHNCIACPDTFTTEKTGNGNASACVCRPGYVYGGEQCTVCPQNTYKVGFNLDTVCNECTENSFGAAGGTGPMECSCSASFEANPYLCVHCNTGKYKNESTKIGISNDLFVASQHVNLARACSGGPCPTYSTGAVNNDVRYQPSSVNDGDLSFFNSFVSWQDIDPYVTIDLQKSVYISRVRIYNRAQCCQEHLWNYDIRIGDSLAAGSPWHSKTINPVCVTNGLNFQDFQDFTCVMKGRYVTLVIISGHAGRALQVRELQIFGTTHSYTYVAGNEWKVDIVSAATILGRCSQCPQNTFTNKTGSLACEACAAGKTTDGRTGQVECVCDVGTLSDADGACQPCPVGSFKATSTDKYANRVCVNCSSCGANQQVNTECNNTHDITCKACQANSWSSAGRKFIDPCFCNAGYQLQGEICVACPVGKARQVNNNNNIVCETCNSTTFTSVSATVSCGSCTLICQNLFCARQLVYDFAPYANLNSLDPWRNYAASFGAIVRADTWGNTGAGFRWFSVLGWNHVPNNPQGHAPGGLLQLTLPPDYSHVTVNYGSRGTVALTINGVIRQQIDSPTAVYSQTYTSPTVLIIYEQSAEIRADIKITLSNFCDSYVQHECNASRDVICQDCQTCKRGFYANNTCGVSYGNDRLDTQCVSCPENAFCPGTTTFQQPLLCSEQRCGANQQVSTLCNTTHNITCRACQANSWSYGRTELGPCLCDAGYELRGGLCVACPVGKARQANYNNSIMCELCATGTFTTVSTTVSCGTCSPVCVDICPEIIYDFSTVALGQPWKDYAAAIGFPTSSMFSWTTCGGGWMGVWNNNAWMQGTLPAAYSFLEVTFYAACANSGSSIGTVVLSIDGVRKATSYGDTVVYQTNYSAGQILRIQEFSAYQDGGIGKNLKIRLYKPCTLLYVKNECNASRDVICQQCQKCGPGFFANNTCGANYNNDRLDTQCVACPAGSYCPTGTGPPILCPDNGKSPPGSISEKACDCDPGYFRDVDGCSLCHFDYYCPGKQIQHAIACPPNSRTARRGSTSRLDCHCHTGFFRDPPERLDSFNCSLCLPGDFCYNNSAYNCTDALMVSAPGSGFFDNCTCVSGYYNNGTVCEDCPGNYYCEGGKRLSCAANEWTAYEGRSYECVCMPGFYRNQDVCVPCTDNYFCDGLDDSRQACPSNAVARLAVGIEDCLCNVSYEAVFSSNVSEPHSCQLCAHTSTFKSTVGNSACVPCTQCLPQQHSAWTQIECTTRADALCDSCTVCYNASLGTPRSQYTTHACQQFFDTECGNCSVCNWGSEFELIPCSETENAVCSPITFQRQCPVGFYAGGHTHTSDSQCLPCAVRNAPYEGQWLHEFTSAGKEYDNRYSCDMQCRPFSRLVNTSDASLGCTTCETGNVLFKIFTQDMLACRFECLEGYVAVNGDCVLGAAEGNELTFWNHSLNVTHVRREEQRNNSGSGAFLVTVSHTAHAHYAVVVGPTEPSCAGLPQSTLTKTALSACCFDALWRVSDTNQLGLPEGGSESCSRMHAPWSTRLTDTQLQFEIPDTRMQELGSCNLYGEVLSCVVQVSIVDIILLRHFSVQLRLEITRSSALAITSTETYVPLSSIRVEAQLAYKEEDGSPVFVVVTGMEPLEGAGITEVLLFGTGLERVQPATSINCARFASGNVSNVSTDAWTLESNHVQTTTFLRGTDMKATDRAAVFIKLFYTLRLRERENTAVKNTMHIAVWRNVSTAHTVCQDEIEPSVVRTGQVLSCSGLGESAVAAATALTHATDAVHGEVGGLTSFVARALHAHVRSVRAVNMLLAFYLPPVEIHANITHMHMGSLGFTEQFRAVCTATPFCHFRYAQRGNGMHLMTSCDESSQNAARTWLRLALGVVHDAGHVTQLCRLAQWQLGREYAFLITLVNTRAYLPQAAQWHDLQNRSAPVSTSKVFALFDFD